MSVYSFAKFKTKAARARREGRFVAPPKPPYKIYEGEWIAARLAYMFIPLPEDALIPVPEMTVIDVRLDGVAESPTNPEKAKEQISQYQNMRKFKDRKRHTMHAMVQDKMPKTKPLFQTSRGSQEQHVGGRIPKSWHFAYASNVEEGIFAKLVEEGRVPSMGTARVMHTVIFYCMHSSFFSPIVARRFLALLERRNVTNVHTGILNGGFHKWVNAYHRQRPELIEGFDRKYWTLRGEDTVKLHIDCYNALELPSDAGLERVRKRYTFLAKTFHDTCEGSDYDHLNFLEIDSAHDILINPKIPSHLVLEEGEVCHSSELLESATRKHATETQDHTTDGVEGTGYDKDSGFVLGYDIRGDIQWSRLRCDSHGGTGMFYAKPGSRSLHVRIIRPCSKHHVQLIVTAQRDWRKHQLCAMLDNGSFHGKYGEWEFNCNKPWNEGRPRCPVAAVKISEDWKTCYFLIDDDVVHEYKISEAIKFEDGLVQSVGVHAPGHRYTHKNGYKVGQMKNKPLIGLRCHPGGRVHVIDEDAKYAQAAADVLEQHEKEEREKQVKKRLLDFYKNKTRGST